MHGPDQPPPRVDWTELHERIRRCRAELRAVQVRLGTAQERATDAEEAVHLGHTIANLLIPLWALRDLPQIADMPDAAAPRS